MLCFSLFFLFLFFTQRQSCLCTEQDEIVYIPRCFKVLLTKKANKNCRSGTAVKIHVDCPQNEEL